MGRISPLFSLPLWFHLLYMAVSAFVLIHRYRQDKKLFRLVMLVGILSTAMVYFVRNGITFWILALEEIALFIFCMVLMGIDTVKEIKKEKQEEAEKQALKGEKDLSESGNS